MQKFICVGNLTKDPEKAETPTGVSYCRFTIAVNRPFTNADGERDADFFNVIAWRGIGDNCVKYLKKGSKASIVGTIQQRSFEKNGEKKTVTELIAQEVEFISRSDKAKETGDLPF